MGNDEKNWDQVKKLIDASSFCGVGKYYSYEIKSDLKHVLFTLSRYKFVYSLLKHKENVKMLELGCQEAMGGYLFKQNLNLKKYVGVDLDEDAIIWNKQNLPKDMEFICANFFDCNILNMEFNAVCCLDVIEHIEPDMEDKFCQVITDNISQDGVAIIGTPNINMSPYASEGSRVAHINLYDQQRLYSLLSKYFNNVFIFGMNDEIINTGFEPMACYIFAVCCNKRNTMNETEL